MFWIPKKSKKSKKIFASLDKNYLIALSFTGFKQYKLVSLRNLRFI